MFFVKEVTVPPNTSKDNPLLFTIQVSAGTVRHVWVRWRWGSANLCGVQIYHASILRWPYSKGEWLMSSQYPLDFDEEFLIPTVPYFFEGKTFNLDSDYSHTVWLGFVILREADYGIVQPITSIW
jgi:hypothetical protein